MRLLSLEVAKRLLFTGRNVFPFDSSESHKTIAFAILHGCVVEDAGAKLGFLTAGALKQAVIDNEGINTILIRERLDCICHFLGQESRKAQPVCLRAVQKTVECVLRERFFERTGLLLHVHAAVREYIAELVLEDIDNGNAFFFLGITFAKQVSDAISAEK